MVAAGFCLVVATGVIIGFVGGGDSWKTFARAKSELHAASPAASAESQALAVHDDIAREFPDPNAPGTDKRVFIAGHDFDNGVFQTAADFMKPAWNESSLEELSREIGERSGRGLSYWRVTAESVHLDDPPTVAQATNALRSWRAVAFLEMYEGRFGEAKTALERALALATTPGVAPLDRAYVRALLGIAALRRGEVENCLECLGPSSCIFPIDRAAVHQVQKGSREAIEHFTAYLREWPGDLQIRWLLNLAYMTLAEYPDKVPAEFLIPLDRFRSKTEVGAFENVAPRAGLGARGPSLAGGSVFDDFNGDGLPDVFATALDVDKGASLFINQGDGTFADRSAAAGLDGEVHALNLTRADYDNDGDLDILLLRGGWEKPAKLSLLRNDGNGVFDDQTIASGMGEPIASESAAWGDFDRDGLVDVFVCGEYPDGPASDPNVRPDPRNRCRLYRNLGNGKFTDVAARAGVLNERYAKGAVWGDYDDDGWVDLFVSNKGSQSGRLYRNQGNGTFRDVAREVGLLGDSPGAPPLTSFPCLFWDFDNDGRLDLLVNDWTANQGEVIASYLGIHAGASSPPHLFRNVGDGHFRDVSHDVGLDHPIPTMAINCGDIDNDGFLDLYLGTGWMSFSGLVPNVLLKNVDGRRLEDVTESSRTGHLQKGHGVSFADWDCDGDLDILTVLGGGYPGDKGFMALFQNPGAPARHFLSVKLVGRQTNRSALGAKIHVVIKDATGAPRSIYRTIGNNGSFGGNSLVETIGLGDAREVSELIVHWPTSGTTQTFRGVKADQSIEITEGAESFVARKNTPLKTDAKDRGPKPATGPHDHASDVQAPVSGK
jgi:tetratricopeptide (TPR) repeat protein